MDDSIVDAIRNGPTLEYFNYYKAINNELSELIHKIGDQITGKGFGCKIVEPSNDTGVQDNNYE